MKMQDRIKQNGFTLIEILVVIGILAVLLAIVLIAINPQRQFQQANNTQRQSDTNAILNAIHAYAAQNKGQLPEGTGTPTVPIPTTPAAAMVIGNDTGEIDLCAALVPLYIADIPLDPTDGTESPASSICTDANADYSSGYTVQSSSTGNRVTVTAPSTEGGGADISVTR